MRSVLFPAALALCALACGTSEPVRPGAPSPANDAGANDAGAGGANDAGASDAGANDATTIPTPGVDSGIGLHIDLSQTSVSGISSGGFMAAQFGVAFSSIIEGIAVFAGGPFDCSQGTLANAESQCANALATPDVTPLIATTKSLATAGAIDDPSHLASARVFLFGGADDVVVSPLVVDATQTYFEAFVPAASIQYVNRRPGTGHTFPTTSYGGLCAASTAPWIGACGYDGAGSALAQIYGTLSPASATATGTISTLAQGDFVATPASHSLDSTAYVYVPTSCAAGETCRVHVAFHGCEMGASGAEGSAFYLHAGYNEWADTNHIVVLYPQAIASSANPEDCWDFWGYDSPAFDTKSAPQMAMTRAMIDALVAGNAGDSGAPSDAGDAGDD